MRKDVTLLEAIAMGGVPSIEDYFKAIEYYKSRA